MFSMIVAHDECNPGKFKSLGKVQAYGAQVALILLCRLVQGACPDLLSLKPVSSMCGTFAKAL